MRIRNIAIFSAAALGGLIAGSLMGPARSAPSPEKSSSSSATSPIFSRAKRISPARSHKITRS